MKIMPVLYRLVEQLTRRQKQVVMVLADFVLLVFAVWVAFSLRLTVWFVPDAEQWVVMVLAPVFAIPVFVQLGLYRAVIRYVGEQAVMAVLKGLSLATIIWALFLLYSGVSGFERVPRSLPGIYWFISVFLVGGFRFLLRFMLGGMHKKQLRNVLIYGANNAGRELIASLKNSREFWPVALLDDDSTFRGRAIDGVRVYGLHAFETLQERFGVQEVIILESAFSTSKRKAIIAKLQGFGVQVRVLPALSEIASGRVLVQALRHVDIVDLLGREPVPPLPELMAKSITGKVVLVTGAGGSIGSELCRQIARLAPKELVLIDSSEYHLYQIHEELKTQGFAGVAVMANVCDASGLNAVFMRFRPDTVYHGAAYKHVPLVEENVLEGIKNNVFGTLNVVRASSEHAVAEMVLVSTDKAVRPTNVMGASKRLAELILQAYAAEPTTRILFSMVRFGNVLGSSGSVVPLFRSQIKNGGPVTVTHEDVTRYFMTIAEAAQLVIQAGAMATGGDVFVLDMGEPVKIIDLARRMIALSGKTVRDAQNPDGDIEIAITGLRAGEKLYEELLIGNAPKPTPHARIFKAEEASLSLAQLQLHLQELDTMIAHQDAEGARALVMRLAG